MFPFLQGLQSLMSYNQDEVDKYKRVGGDIAKTVGSGLIADTAGGLAGLAATPFVGAEGGAEIVGDIQDRWTYKPTDKDSIEALKTVGEAMAPLEEGKQYMGGRMQDMLPEGSPEWLKATAGTAGYMLPELLGTAIGAGPAMRTGRAVSKTIDDVVDTSGINRGQFGQGGMMSRKFTPAERARADAEGVPYQDHEIGGFTYTEVLDPEARATLDATMGTGYPHKMYKARPELGESSLLYPDDMPRGTGRYDPKNDAVLASYANADDVYDAVKDGLDPKTLTDAQLDMIEILAHEGGHAATKKAGYPTGGRASVGGRGRKMSMMDDVFTERQAAKKSPEYKNFFNQVYDYEMENLPPGQKGSLQGQMQAQRTAAAAADKQILGRFTERRDKIDKLSDFDTYERLQDEYVQRVGASREAAIASMVDSGTPEEAARQMMRDTPLKDPAGIQQDELIRKFDESAQSDKAPTKRGPKAQATFDSGVQHPLGGGKNMKQSIDDFTRVTQSDPNLPQQERFDPPWQEWIDNETTLLSAVGDRSDFGKSLMGVNGIDFENPVQLQGGRGYMTQPDVSWASKEGVVSGLNKRVQDLKDRGRDPMMSYVSMAHNPTDFNTMMSDTYFEMMNKAPISKTAMQQFDRAMRKTVPKWKGIHDPESSEMFHNVGAVRKEFMRLAKLDQFANRFPDIASARFGVTDPELMNVPVGTSGMGFSHPSGRVNPNPNLQHKTYDTAMEADRGYQGAMKEGIPLEDFWQTWTQERLAKGNKDKLNMGQDFASMRYKPAEQDVTPQWVDSIVDAQERMRASNLDPNSEYLSSPNIRKKNIGKFGGSRPEEMIKQLQETGGFTRQAYTGQAPEGGYMMSKYPNETATRTAELQNAAPDDVAAFMEKNKDVLSVPGNYVGGWLDKNTNTTYLDIAERFDDYDKAVKSGKATDQLAGYDVNDYPDFEKKLGGKLTGDWREFDVVPDAKAKATREKRRKRLQQLADFLPNASKIKLEGYE